MKDIKWVPSAITMVGIGMSLEFAGKHSNSNRLIWLTMPPARVGWVKAYWKEALHYTKFQAEYKLIEKYWFRFFTHPKYRSICRGVGTQLVKLNSLTTSRLATAMCAELWTRSREDLGNLAGFLRCLLKYRINSDELRRDTRKARYLWYYS